MSRLEVELFDPRPDPDLVCAICQCVIAEPTEIMRCRHVFCRGCIRAWLSRGAHSCPSCRSTVTENDLQSALPILCNVIGRLLMSCINRAAGCKVRLAVERLDVHLRNDCRYVTIKCHCGTDVMRFEQAQHEQRCTRKVKCRRVCQMDVSACDLETHDCAQLLKVRLEGARSVVVVVVVVSVC